VAVLGRLVESRLMEGLEALAAKRHPALRRTSSRRGGK